MPTPPRPSAEIIHDMRTYAAAYARSGNKDSRLWILLEEAAQRLENASTITGSAIVNNDARAWYGINMLRDVIADGSIDGMV